MMTHSLVRKTPGLLKVHAGFVKPASASGMQGHLVRQHHKSTTKHTHRLGAAATPSAGAEISC